MNKQMVLLCNRILESIYKVCHFQGLDYSKICVIQNEVRTHFDMNLSIENPFLQKLKKTNKIDQVLFNIGEYNSTEFIKSLSLTIRDLTLQLEGKREQTRELKLSKKKPQKYIEYNERELNQFQSELLVYYEVLTDLEECSTEDEMNEVIERLKIEAE